MVDIDFKRFSNNHFVSELLSEQGSYYVSIVYLKISLVGYWYFWIFCSLVHWSACQIRDNNLFYLQWVKYITMNLLTSHFKSIFTWSLNICPFEYLYFNALLL